MKANSILVLALAVASTFASPALAQAVYDLPAISEEGGPVARCRIGYALSALRCTGRYCDNIQGTCKAYNAPPAQLSTIAPYWTAWYSEEQNADVIEGSNFPKLADWYSVAIGFQCRGSYCDDLRFLMRPMRGRSGSPTMDSKSEYPQCRLSPRFSEEQSSPPQPAAPQGKGMEFIRRAGCSGRYCDNLQIEWCKVFHNGWNW